jgi:lambda family phage portal protein
MKITERFSAAWRAAFGKPATAPRLMHRDPYAGTYGSGGGHGFAGASIGRLTAGLASWSASVNADLDGSLIILRARSRSLAANNEHGKRFLSLVASNVVGRAHPKLQVRAMRDQANPNKPTTLDKPANDAIEAHWDRWGRTCDITGRHQDLAHLLRTVMKSVARDGEALIRRVQDKRLPYGTALQLLEADRLDESYNLRLDNGNTVRQGVEIDSAGRAVAYYIKTAHPGENYGSVPNKIERVPAGEMIHLFLAERAEQVRGVPWMHAVILRAAQLHEFEESAVIAARIGASKIAALEHADDAPDAVDAMADGRVGGIPQMSIQAGEMFDLPPGTKLSSWNPDYPHANFESFLKACLRGLAAGLDVADHNLTGDMSGVNYSSARIAELSEREMWMILQDWLIASLVRPVYREWLGYSLLSGSITFDISGKSLPAERFEKFFNASRFQGRRWKWVDPAKEAEANEKQLASNLTSRTRLAAEQGEEFDDILDELKAEAEMIKAAGLAPVEKPAAPPPPAPPPPDPAMGKAVALLLARAAEPPAPTIVPAPANTTFNVEVSAEGMRAAGAEVMAQMRQNAADTMAQIREDIQNMPIIIPAPVVNIAATQITNEITVEPTPVTLEAVIQPAEVKLDMPARRTDTEVEYNLAGDIVRSTAIERNA